MDKKIVTCGGDALVKIWNCDPPLQSFEKRTGKRSRKTTPPKSGVMRVHGNQIQQLVKLSEHSFVSVGKDNLVIFWRDGNKEQLLRDKIARECLIASNTTNLISPEKL